MPDLGFLWTAILAALPFIIGGGAVVGIMWYVTKHPDSKYLKYYPLVVAAVKYVEKTIPNDTENKTLAKIDAFAEEFTRTYEENIGKEPSEATKAWAMRAKELVLLEIEKK